MRQNVYSPFENVNKNRFFFLPKKNKMDCKYVHLFQFILIFVFRYFRVCVCHLLALLSKLNNTRPATAMTTICIWPGRKGWEMWIENRLATIVLFLPFKWQFKSEQIERAEAFFPTPAQIHRDPHMHLLRKNTVIKYILEFFFLARVYACMCVKWTREIKWTKSTTIIKSSHQPNGMQNLQQQKLQMFESKNGQKKCTHTHFQHASAHLMLVLLTICGQSTSSFCCYRTISKHINSFSKSSTHTQINAKPI